MGRTRLRISEVSRDPRVAPRVGYIASQSPKAKLIQEGGGSFSRAADEAAVFCALEMAGVARSWALASTL
eukprot:5720184-Pyramimonas_sp.AAC.2